MYLLNYIDDFTEMICWGILKGSNFDEIINKLGLEKLCFEVTSPREGLKKWYKDLSSYIELFGSDCNVCNIMPSQILQVEPLRDDNLLRQF